MEAAVCMSVSSRMCVCLSEDECGLVVAVTTKIYQSLKKLISVLSYSFKFNVYRTIKSAVDHGCHFSISRLRFFSFRISFLCRFSLLV